MKKQQGKGAKLFIKNMVCLRCMKTVRQLVESVGGEITDLALGEVGLKSELSTGQINHLAKLLEEDGFELLDSRVSRLVSLIKNLVIREIHFEEGLKSANTNFSTFLSKQTGLDYTYLSKLFSSVAGVTIEKFIIAQKVERIKELLSYEELSVSEIAWQLDYSSPQHMANQFRQLTGMSPMEFRKNHSHERKHLDHV